MRKRSVERRDDMSPHDKLILHQQEDGDVIVGMFIDPNNSDFRPTCFPSVEFTFPGAGGGRSPRTLRALKDLITAIELDNTENPIVE